MASKHVRTASLNESQNGRPVRNANNANHVRQRSDIDSLSPEVVAALQSTFGGRLSELRSQNSLPKKPQPERSPLQPTPPVIKEVDETEDSDREGKFLVAAYVTGILSSITILFTAGYQQTEDVLCGGGVESRCVRLYGYIVPIGVTGISLLLALVLSVFDVSFGVYNVLSTTEKYFLQATLRFSDIPEVALSYIMDIGFVSVAVSLLWLARASTVNPLFTLCQEGVKLFWTFGLILMGTVIFWCAVKSVRDPEATHLFMRRATKIVIVLFVFFGVSSLLYYIVAPPQARSPCPDSAEVNVTEDSPLQLFKGWWSEVALPKPEPKPIQLYSEAHRYDWCPTDQRQCKVRKNLPVCEPRIKPGVCEAKDDDLGMCEARYDQGTCEARYDQGMCEARYEQGTSEARCDEGMCEARVDDRGMCKARYDRGTCKARADEGVCAPRYKQNEMCEARDPQECEWPWLKRIQVYERDDKCKYDFPLCDWPLVKRIQLYESKELCKYNCPSCDWPLVKRIQVYSRVDRCATLTHPKCDWPYLKQIQRYEAKGRCYRDDRPLCEWPFLKQIQSYEAWNWCSALHYQQCDWPAPRFCVAHESTESCTPE